MELLLAGRRAEPGPEVGEGKLHDVFVCYATKDAARVNKIVSDLEAEGLRCWIAPRDIGPGRNFQVEIVGAIDSSKAMLVMMSRAMNQSEECINEIAVAKGSDTCKLIPVRLQDEKPERGYRFYLTAAQWVEHHADPAGTVDAVFATLGIERNSAGRIAREPVQRPATPSQAREGGQIKEKTEPPTGKASVIPYAWNPAYLLFDWNGRLGRRMFLFGLVLNAIVWSLLSMLLVGATSPLVASPKFGQPVAIVGWSLYFFLSTYTGLALYVKRIHDLSRKAWKVLALASGSVFLGLVCLVFVGLMNNPEDPLAMLCALLSMLLLGVPLVAGPLVLLIYPGNRDDSNQFGIRPSYSSFWEPYDRNARIASASPEYDLIFLLMRGNGRISRMPFAMGLLFAAWLGFLFTYMDYVDGDDTLDRVLNQPLAAFQAPLFATFLLGAIAIILCIYCMFSVISKRLHDFGWSSWWGVLIVSVILTVAMFIERSGYQFYDTGSAGHAERFFAIVASIVFLAPLALVPGSSGFNRFGPPPGFRVEALRAGQEKLA
jgi:uncharacterized membrane protein YhaH (DUF805 family)